MSVPRVKRFADREKESKRRADLHEERDTFDKNSMSNIGLI